MSAYECTRKSLPALRLAQVSAHVDAQPEIAEVMGPLYGRLAQALSRQGATLGPSIAWYDMDADGDGQTVHAAWEYSGAAASGFEVVELPAVPDAVTCTFSGPISRIAEPWQDMARWWSEQGLEPDGPCREIYLTEPPADPDGEWVVELQQPVRHAS